MEWFGIIQCFATIAILLCASTSLKFSIIIRPLAFSVGWKVSGMETQCDLYSFIVSNTKVRRKKRNTINECCLLCDKQKNWLDKMVGAILYWVVRRLQSLANRDQYLIVSWRSIFADSIWTDSKKGAVVFWQKIWFFDLLQSPNRWYWCWEVHSTTAVNTLHFFWHHATFAVFYAFGFVIAEKVLFPSTSYTFWEIFFILEYGTWCMCVHEKTISFSILFFFSITLHQTNYFCNEEFIH